MLLLPVVIKFLRYRIPSLPTLSIPNKIRPPVPHSSHSPPITPPLSRLLRLEDIHCVESDLGVCSGDRTGPSGGNLTKLDVPSSLVAVTATNKGIQVTTFILPHAETAFLAKIQTVLI